MLFSPPSLTNISSSCFNPKATNDSSTQSEASLWLGRAMTNIKDAANHVGNKLTELPSYILTVAKHASDDTNMTATFFRKTNNQLIHVVAHVRGLPADTWSKFREGMQGLIGIVDFFQLAVEIDYFTGRKLQDDYAKGKTAIIAGHVGFTTAEIGGGTLWLNDLGFIDLGKISAKVADTKVLSFIPKLVAAIPGIRNWTALQRLANTIGDLRIFSFVTKISLLSVTLRALALGYLFFAIDALQRMIDPVRSQIEKISAGWDFTALSSELILDALVLAGVTNIWGLGAAAAAAVVFGTISLGYRMENGSAMAAAQAKRDNAAQNVKV